MSPAAAPVSGRGGVQVLLEAAAGSLHGVGAFRALHRLCLPDAVSVAAYHGLTAEPLPVPDACFTDLPRFRAQMHYLARHFQVLHLEEALSPTRPPSRRPVACITFDEGYRGVYEHALPVLESLALPATVYLVTDLVGSDDTVWFARLHQALTETGATQVEHEGQVFPLDSKAARARASALLQAALKRLPAGRLEASLGALLGRLGLEAGRSPPAQAPFRLLDARQIARLARDDLVRIGAHTASHQILTRTTPAAAYEEMERSVRAVARLVPRPSASFAYPNGGPEDFDEASVTGLRRLGLRFAVTTLEGPNGRDVDPYRVRRYCVGRDEPLWRFAGRMHHGRALLRALRGRRG